MKNNEWEFLTDVKELQETLTFWNNVALKHKEEAEYYMAELAKAHELLGRVIHQTSERWDTVNLTRYFPTSNLHRLRNQTNPGGKK